MEIIDRKEEEELPDRARHFTRPGVWWATIPIIMMSVSLQSLQNACTPLELTQRFLQYMCTVGKVRGQVLKWSIAAMPYVLSCMLSPNLSLTLTINYAQPVGSYRSLDDVYMINCTQDEGTHVFTDISERPQHQKDYTRSDVNSNH